MLFNSYIFVFLFLPVCVVGYFSLNHFKFYHAGQLFLLGMSLWFYGYFNPKYLWIILASTFFNFAIYRVLDCSSFPVVRKILLTTAIVFNLGILFYFKYFDFFLENINVLFKTDFAFRNLLLPLGVSFFTFQQLSFIIDAYKKEIPQYDLVSYMSFVTFFPQLIAGPIVTHDELIPQFLDPAKKCFDWDHFSQGVYLFVLGLSKKVLIADIFGNATNWGFSNIDMLDSTNALLTVLAYTIQIYFDFSGYSDMAIGIGWMMNLELPTNFDSPYKSFTITEFWERWHITLTRFFTRYIYIPLGGNRKGEMRTYLNIMIVFLISGLWHGANYTFILWGTLHGLFSILTRWKNDFFQKLHPAFNWLITFAFVNITWVFFRADSIHDALRILHRIADFNFQAINTTLLSYFDSFNLKVIFSHIPKLSVVAKYPNWFLVFYFLLALFLILGPRNACEQIKPFKRTISNVLVSSILLILCIFSFSSVSTFLYFNF